jgi:hypothetical protein
VKLARDPAAAEAPLSFTFVKGTRAVEVAIDENGFDAHDTVSQHCGGEPCALRSMRPQCTTAKLWEEALRFGASKDDHATISLVAEPTPPVWRFAVANRGEMTIEDATCARTPRSRLVPARTLTDVPGAPHSVDPLRLLDITREQSGLESDALLVGLTLTFVDATGRVDLDGPRRVGSFSVDWSDPPNTGGRQRRRHVLIDRRGFTTTEVEPIPFDPVPPPRCTVPNLLRRVPDVIATPDETILDYRAWPNHQPTVGQWWIRVRSSSHTILDIECDSPPPSERPAPERPAKPR